MDDLMMYELAQFIAWGMELLQDDSIPFSVALETVLSAGIEASDYYKQRDFENFEQAATVCKFVYPVIHDLFAPDLSD